MWILAQADASSLIPSSAEVAGWSASQTIQWLLVTVLIGVAVAAYWGMKALSRSNEMVNANYDRTINVMAQRYEIQDERYERQEQRHAERDQRTHEVLKDIAVSLESVARSTAK